MLTHYKDSYPPYIWAELGDSPLKLIDKEKLVTPQQMNLADTALTKRAGLINITSDESCDDLYP